MRKSTLVTLFLILAFILSGCSQNTFTTNSLPSFDDNSLLMFKNEMNEEVGELYGIKLDGEEYFVANDAKNMDFFMNQNTGEIIYRNEEDSFYSILNDEKNKIASDVKQGSFNKTENYKYFFLDNGNDALYTLNEKYEKEKITTEIGYWNTNSDG
ncbi:MAG: hypothetical protein ACERLG_09790, partial [Sedimentibacter sp.]